MQDGEDDIYVMNPSGSRQIRLTFNSINAGHPEGSPDGSKIVFMLKNDIYVMDPDGSNQKRLAWPDSYYLL